MMLFAISLNRIGNKLWISNRHTNHLRCFQHTQFWCTVLQQENFALDRFLNCCAQNTRKKGRFFNENSEQVGIESYNISSENCDRGWNITPIEWSRKQNSIEAVATKWCKSARLSKIWAFKRKDYGHCLLGCSGEPSKTRKQ